MKIGIISSGAGGSILARYAIATGHEVVLASRRRDKLTEVVAALGRGAYAAIIAGAAEADMTILAVPWTAKEEALNTVNDWTKKILVDATNA